LGKVSSDLWRKIKATSASLSPSAPARVDAKTQTPSILSAKEARHPARHRGLAYLYLDIVANNLPTDAGQMWLAFPGIVVHRDKMIGILG
jgi:hypothetical protein